MEHEEHHEELISEISNIYSPILDNSSQAIYIYLDDHHKVCNKKFASLLGYKSPKEWAESRSSFTDLFVDSKSQNALVSAYKNAMEHQAASQVDITWKSKNGKPVRTKVILVPIIYNSHIFALHFVYQ